MKTTDNLVDILVGAGLALFIAGVCLPSASLGILGVIALETAVIISVVISPRLRMKKPAPSANRAGYGQSKTEIKDCTIIITSIHGVVKEVNTL